jgi:ketosteroid isomerase-like protein
MSDTDTTRAVLERFYAAIGAWDEYELLAVLHEDAEVHQPACLPYGGVYRGPEQLFKLWKEIVLPMVDPATVHLDSMTVEGDRAVVIAGGDLNATGRPVLACEEYVVRDGRIATIRMFWQDPTPVAEAASLAARR